MSGTQNLWGIPSTSSAIMPLPNTQQLVAWQSGDQLAAADLNWNFALLLNMIMSVRAGALAADPQTADNTADIVTLAEHIELIERQQSRPRQNQPDAAPMAMLAQIIKQLDEVRKRLEKLEAKAQ